MTLQSGSDAPYGCKWRKHDVPSLDVQAGPVTNKPFDEAYDLSQSDSDER